MKSGFQVFRRCSGGDPGILLIGPISRLGFYASKGRLSVRWRRVGRIPTKERIILDHRYEVLIIGE